MATVVDSGIKDRALKVLDGIDRDYANLAGGMATVATSMMRGWFETTPEETIIEELGKLSTLLTLILHGTGNG